MSLTKSIEDFRERKILRRRKQRDFKSLLVYGTPSQMTLLVNTIQFEAYERLKFFCVGETGLF